MFYVVPAPGQSGAFVLETDSTQNKAWGQETRLLSWDTHNWSQTNWFLHFYTFAKDVSFSSQLGSFDFGTQNHSKSHPKSIKKIDIDFNLDFGIVFGRPKIDF
jgi:hypothetical protein